MTDCVLQEVKEQKEYLDGEWENQPQTKPNMLELLSAIENKMRYRPSPANLRAELVRIAALSVAGVEEIDRKEGTKFCVTKVQRPRG